MVHFHKRNKIEIHRAMCAALRRRKARARNKVNKYDEQDASEVLVS